MKDILRSDAGAESKAFVDEFMSECKSTSTNLHNSTDFLLAQEGGGGGPSDPEIIFGTLMEALEEYNNVENQYGEWSARIMSDVPDATDNHSNAMNQNLNATNTIAPGSFHAETNAHDAFSVDIMEALDPLQFPLGARNDFGELSEL